MSVIYGKKKNKHSSIAYTIITVLLVCAMLILMVAKFYQQAEDEALEMLHMQTKQIKDNIVLQIKSDRENLVTMANFAAKLYSSGESYNIMLESFKPIGLISEIGILNPDNTFVTRAGKIDLNGKISFEEEVNRDEYISGRVKDVTVKNKEVLRASVPIVVGDNVVGIMYGIVPLELINNKYSTMANEQNSQLFVYNKKTGAFIVDTFNDYPGRLSDFQSRKFNKGYSYEQILVTDSGYSSFKSAITGEDTYIHYSTIEEFNWCIMLAKYETQVFSQVRRLTGSVIGNFVIIGIIVFLYLIFTFRRNNFEHTIVERSSNIRRLLLDFNQQYNNIFEAMKNVQEVSDANVVFYADNDGEEYRYSLPSYKKNFPTGEDWKSFMNGIFGYTLNRDGKSTISIAYIEANQRLLKANPEMYNLMKKCNFREVSFSVIANKDNHISVLGAVNANKTNVLRKILKDISACFSIAVYNRKHLNKTELTATTDALTGTFNRVAYKEDVLQFERENPKDFACIYIDVNELHTRNNLYGHAAGDEMLKFIANTLKEVFYGYRVYRMGGDEFLIFTRGYNQSRLVDMIDSVVSKLKTKEYNISVGVSFANENVNCEELVKDAEARMYSAKSQYYFNKEQNQRDGSDNSEYIHIKTGINEIDATISVLKEKYNSIYKVSLSSDDVRCILMPAYLGYNEEEKHFSKLMSKYAENYIESDFRRPVFNFLNYDALKKQLSEGKTSRITYKKTSGETEILSVYNISKNPKEIDETLWVFAKM